MDDILQQTAIETVPELPRSYPVPRLSIVYLPQLGFYITMPVVEADQYTDNLLLNDDWERIFRTEMAAYFKNDRMRAMDRELGDLWASICEIEIELSHDLAQRVLEREALLITASDICGELDAILALAHGAVKYKLVRPEMVKENIIDVKAGRHLIQELTVPLYVANDAHLVGGDGRDRSPAANAATEHPNMLLLTGPNYSGKSVYLRQVALIVYMAQIGSFVPAERVRLGITDRIMTRITTRETVSRAQSSFMIDLQQISWALNGFTHRSLLVIDEFGKGTDSCDGAGLAAGVLKYLITRGSHAPKVLASTHFHEIFEQGHLQADMPGLGLRQMEVIIQHKGNTRRGVGDHNSEATYLYNVRPGRSTLSYGAQCAAMNGIPASIVGRACQLNEMLLAGEDIVAACTSVSEEERVLLEEAEAVCRDFLALDVEALRPEEVVNFKDVLGELVASNSSHH